MSERTGMLIDGRSVEDGSEIETDVAIVGAGPAGISLALGLAATGRVLLLESGGLDIEPEPQRMTGGTSTGYPYHRLDSTRVRAFGGTSRHWPLTTEGGDEGWLARPFDAIDFETRPGIPHTGWPITRQDLDPYYARAMALGELAPMAWEGRDWAGLGERGLDDPAPVDLSPDVVTRVFQRVPTSFLGHLPEIARSPSITLAHHSTVLELLAVDGHRVDGLTVTARPGSSFTVRARYVVLATGGIENARILLLAASRGGAGFGNEHGLVGRYFMERLSARTGVVEPSDALRGDVDFYLSHLTGERRIQGTISIDEDVLRREALLNSTFFFIPRSRAFAAEGTRSAITLGRSLRRSPRLEGTRGYLRNVLREADQVARVGLERFVGRLATDDVLLVGAQAEQAPDPSSRVTLGTDRDDLGQPRARVHWQIGDRDRASIRRSQDLLDAALQRHGLGRLVGPLGTESPPALFIAAFHHMGTTRMATDPRHGVVDGDGRVHGMDNLYVTGGSVFATSGFANPTLTIVALAARLGDHLAGVLRGAPGTVSAVRAPATRSRRKAATATPVLTLCMPTYRRPDLLAASLRSVSAAIGQRAADVEVLISDNAPEEGEAVARAWLDTYPGPGRYIGNTTDIGAIPNFNQCITEARGRFVMMLHDDDYLLPGALPQILSELDDAGETRCFLFGVLVVDGSGQVLRSQGGRVDEQLSPAVALKRVLSNSSLVRIPAVVMRRDALIEVGLFDPAVGSPTDFDLFVRLFGRYGLTSVASTVSAYTVHEEAQTTGMFRPETIPVLMGIFDRAIAGGVLPGATVRRCEVDWFYQFILGGMYRRLRQGDIGEARRIEKLFRMPEVQALGRSGRWWPISTVFSILVRLPPWVARVLIRSMRRLGLEHRIWMSL